MKKYFVIEVVSYVDGTPDSVAIAGFETRTQAFASYHQKAAGAMKNENYKSQLLTIEYRGEHLDDFGLEIMTNYVKDEFDKREKEPTIIEAQDDPIPPADDVVEE